jgi:hypothetical protein
MSDRYCNDCRELQGYRLVRCRDARGGYPETKIICVAEEERRWAMTNATAVTGRVGFR